MEINTINNYKFIKFQYGNAVVLFSTANNDLNFNKSTEVGLLNIKKVKEHHHLQAIGYLNQIHSDIILNFDVDSNNQEGDALITDQKTQL